MERIEGYVDHIIYRNQDNGYTVMNVIADGEEITCVGLLHYIGDGELVEITGHYKDHATYGRQLQIETLEIKAPEDELSIERYLGSGAVKGIGVSLAARIVRKFHEDTFRIMEEEPERLAEVKGISEKKAREIAAQMEEKKDMRKAMIFLQQYGISTTLGVKIYNQYGNNIYQVIKENPYQMADDINGVGFRIADEIASKVGIHTDSDYRIRCGLLYVLQQAMSEGHVFLPKEILEKRTVDLLGVSQEAVEKTHYGLGRGPEAGGQGDGGQSLCLRGPGLLCGADTAKMLHDLNISCEISESAVLTKVAAIEKRTGTILDEMQKEAVVQAAGHGLMVLTGGPGTGKNDDHQHVDFLFRVRGSVRHVRRAHGPGGQTDDGGHGL